MRGDAKEGGMLEAASVTASVLGLACVVIAIWRKDLYRQAMFGWSLSLFVMGVAQLLLAADHGTRLRVISGVLWVVAGAVLAASLLTQGRRRPTSSQEDSPP
jgi:membrane-bound ClpP family serine protease